MSQGSGIEWTQATWNPLAGCTPVSPGCLNCYAATMAHRLAAMGQEKYKGLTEERPGPGGTTRHVFNGVVRLDEGALAEPLRRRLPTTWFVNSMSDLFHEKVPFEFVDKVFAVMAMCPRHTFQVLTKRPGRMGAFFERRGVSIDALALMAELAPKGLKMGDTCLSIEDGRWNLPNVHLGTSCEDQARLDERVPELLGCRAAVRFLSLEPLLGPIHLRHLGLMAAVGRWWVIVGGESGAWEKVRSCDLAWVRSVVAQCKAAGVPVFVKQLGRGPFSVDEERKHAWGRVAIDVHALAFGGWTLDSSRLKDPKGGDPAEWPEDLRVREMPAGVKTLS